MKDFLKLFLRLLVVLTSAAAFALGAVASVFLLAKLGWLAALVGVIIFTALGITLCAWSAQFHNF